MTDTFIFKRESGIDPLEFKDILIRSTLGARRPIDDDERLEKMCANASLIITCRRKNDNLLIGIARSITDFSYCTYLSDLAVDAAFQKQGIGKKLIEETHALAGKDTLLVLLSAPAARDYYPHIGMEKHDSCWILKRNPAQ